MFIEKLGQIGWGQVMEGFVRAEEKLSDNVKGVNAHGSGEFIL